MEERTTGLILRTRPLTETSLIVQWLTPDLGRLSTVAKGARRARSPFAGKLDLLYLAEFSFYRSRRSQLHTLREVSVRDFNPVLRRDVERLQQACYFVQLLEQTTEADTPLPGLFQLLVDALHTMSCSPSQALTVIAFEAKLLEILGQQPDYGQSILSPGAREIVLWLTRAEWTSFGQLQPSAAHLDELNRYLRRFMVYHFGRVPKARSAAIQVA